MRRRTPFGYLLINFLWAASEFFGSRARGGNPMKPDSPAEELLGSILRVAGAAVPGAVLGARVSVRGLIHAARWRRTSNTSPRAAA